MRGAIIKREGIPEIGGVFTGLKDKHAKINSYGKGRRLQRASVNKPLQRLLQREESTDRGVVERKVVGLINRKSQLNCDAARATGSSGGTNVNNNVASYMGTPCTTSTENEERGGLTASKVGFHSTEGRMVRHELSV